MSKITKCIVCHKTENEVPIIKFKFKGKKYTICSQHIPVLIHKAQDLDSVLPGIQPTEDENQ